MLQRYTLTAYTQASPGTRKVYDEFSRMTGEAETPNWLASMGHNTALARAYWEKVKGCLLAGELPALLKEMVAYVVSRENGAVYGEAYHAHALLQLDRRLHPADLAKLLTPDCAVVLPPAHRAALEFAVRMAWDAKAVDDEAFEDLLRDGFTRDDIQELLAVIDLTLMFNCYTNALRLPVDPHYALPRRPAVV